MVRRRLLPSWLRRGLEAGVIGALLALGTLVAFQLSRPAPRLTLPNGLDVIVYVDSSARAWDFMADVSPGLAGTLDDVLAMLADSTPHAATARASS